MADTKDVKYTPELRLRVLWGNDAMLGPGKADLLDHIAETGSIAAAGRRMSMSYKRAWMLVEVMNTTFQGPLVDSTRGGARGGGASLTPLGREILALYRDLVRVTSDAGADRMADLTARLKQPSDKG